MLIEILIGLLVLTTLVAIGGIIGIVNARKNMESMITPPIARTRARY